MLLLYKTEVRAEGKRAASSAAVGAMSHYEHSTEPGRGEEGPGSSLARDGGAFGAIDAFPLVESCPAWGLCLTIYG